MNKGGVSRQEEGLNEKEKGRFAFEILKYLKFTSRLVTNLFYKGNVWSMHKS